MNDVDNLHILVIPSFYWTQEEPVKGAFFKEQSESIKALGMNVGIIFPELRSVKGLTFDRLINNHFQSKLYDEEGINVYRKHRWNIVPTKFMMGKYLWVKSAIKLADKYIKKFGKPDLIHAHCALWAGFAAQVISKKYNIPYIVTEHSTAYARNMLNLQEKRIVHNIFDKSEKVIVVSNPFKKLLHEYLEVSLDKMIVIPNFIDTNKFNLSNVRFVKEGTFTFLSIAFLNEKKGMDKLLKAFSKEFKGNRNVKLKIGGDGPDRMKLQKLSDDLELSSQVEFLGLLSRDEVVKHMNEANCFVLASNVETFGVVFIEAMATGLPVIATRSGGPEDIIIPQVGYLVDNTGIDELSIALRNVHHRYDDFDHLVIRKYVEDNFSNRVVSKKVQQLYLKILEL